MLIFRDTGDENAEHAIVSPITYPNIPASIHMAHPLPLARLYSNYVEGLRSSSPFYAFLCFFALTEFLTTTLQGRLRRLAKAKPITYVDLTGALTAEEARYTGRFAAGTTYASILAATRTERIAIAHFLIEP